MILKKLKEILEVEGFRPKLDKEGDLIFKYEGQTYFLDATERDEQFLRVVLPNFWTLESDDETKKALELSVELTKKLKVVKVYPVKNRMWTSVELLLPNEEAFADVLDRTLFMLSVAAVEFREEMSAASFISSEG